MPTFETREPISVNMELSVGQVHVVAADRSNTIVEVRPTDPTKRSDTAAAEQTRVEYANGRLTIKAPKGWKQWSPRGGGESIDVQIDLPAGSDLRGEAGVASLTCVGRLGECSYKTGAGEIQLDDAGPVNIKTGAGDVTVGSVAGVAQIKTGTGGLRIGYVNGPATVRNSNGDTWIGEVTGDVRVNAANGKIAIEQVHSGAAAKTACGDIRLGAVERGAITAETALGNVEIGIISGVAAWLDISTRYGNVVSELDPAEQPQPSEGTVEVRARSSFGDIAIRRVLVDVKARNEA